MSDKRKKLSGGAYKKLATEKAQRDRDLLAKVLKIDSFFKPSESKDGKFLVLFVIVFKIINSKMKIIFVSTIQKKIIKLFSLQSRINLNRHPQTLYAKLFRHLNLHEFSNDFSCRIGIGVLNRLRYDHRKIREKKSETKSFTIIIYKLLFF